MSSSDAVVREPTRETGGGPTPSTAAASETAVSKHLEAENRALRKALATLQTNALLTAGDGSPKDAPEGDASPSTTMSTTQMTPRTTQSDELERELLLTLVNDLRSQSKRDQHRISALKSRIEELAAAKVSADKVAMSLEARLVKEQDLQLVLRKNIASLSAGKLEQQQLIGSYRDLIVSQRASYMAEAEAEKAPLREAVAVLEAQLKTAQQQHQREKEHLAWQIAALKADVDKEMTERTTVELSMNAYKDLCVAQLAAAHVLDKKSPPKVVFADGSTPGNLASAAFAASDLFPNAAAAVFMPGDLLSAFGSRTRDLLSPFRSAAAVATPAKHAEATAAAVAAAAMAAVTPAPADPQRGLLQPFSRSGVARASSAKPQEAAAVATPMALTAGGGTEIDEGSATSSSGSTGTGSTTTSARSSRSNDSSSDHTGPSPRGILKKYSPPPVPDAPPPPPSSSSPLQPYTLMLAAAAAAPAGDDTGPRTVETLELELNVVKKMLVTRDIEVAACQAALADARDEVLHLTAKRDELRRKLARDRFGVVSHTSTFVPLALAPTTALAAKRLRDAVASVVAGAEAVAAADDDDAGAVSPGSGTDSDSDSDDELADVEWPSRVPQKAVAAAAAGAGGGDDKRRMTEINWMDILSNATSAFFPRDTAANSSSGSISSSGSSNSSSNSSSDSSNTKSNGATGKYNGDVTKSMVGSTATTKTAAPGPQKRQPRWSIIDGAPSGGVRGDGASVSDATVSLANSSSSNSIGTTHGASGGTSVATSVGSVGSSSTPPPAALDPVSIHAVHCSDPHNYDTRPVGRRSLSAKGKTLFRELQPGSTNGPVSSLGKPYRQVFNLSTYPKEADSPRRQAAALAAANAAAAAAARVEVWSDTPASLHKRTDRHSHTTGNVDGNGSGGSPAGSDSSINWGAYPLESVVTSPADSCTSDTS